MRDYVLMTDSCCDLGSDKVHEYQLTVLPLSFRWNDQQWEDTPDNPSMPRKDFFDLLRNGATVTTAGVNVGDYENCMRAILKESLDILCLSFSSALSSTYQSAVIAANLLKEEYPEAKILVLDTKSASLGQGMLLSCAYEQKQSGKSIDEVYAALLEQIPRMCHWFTVDDLNYLRRGGRLSGAAAVVGSMLNIKPILHCDDEGRLVSVGKVRGRKASLQTLVDKMKETALLPLEEQTVCIVHGDCEEEVEQMVRTLYDEYHVKHVYTNYLGAVIGSHTGPGTIGLFWLGSQR